MIDPFVLLLTPILVLAVVALFGFVGCNQLFGLDPTQVGADAAQPTFDPLPGTYALPLSVSLADDTPGAIIHYTTDGSTPTSASPLYSDPISVSAPPTTTTIKAIASAAGHDNSPMVQGEYTIAPITYHQLAENQEKHNSNSVATIPFTSNVTGNLIVVWIWYNSIVQKVAGVTDTAGNHYQWAVGPTPGDGTLAGWQQEIWYATVINGGLLAVTATFLGSFNAEKAIGAHEYSGADAVDPLDTTGALAGSIANAATPAVTTNARLIFGAAIFDNDMGASAGMDFTKRSMLLGNVTEDKLTNPGLALATFTNPAQSWIAQMVAFK